jgi:hypothetical protein
VFKLHVGRDVNSYNLKHCYHYNTKKQHQPVTLLKNYTCDISILLQQEG